MLTVADLTVRYGDVVAVRDAHLEIADGEVLALLGPSGSGKSTLLRAIAGLERAASGEVRWDGDDLGDVPVHRRNFGLVFQDGQLFPHRDVAGNIAFGLRMRGSGAQDRVERVTTLLDLVGLAGYGRRRVTELSGGEAQRVALARALAPRPRLLLLDEPLSGLDAELREQLAIEVTELLRRTKTTTLLVTHDQEEAFTLADRIAVLDGGVIRQVGDVLDVWRRPVDERLARFLGVTTVVPGQASGGRVRCALGEVSLPWARDGEVLLGLRPGAVRAVDLDRFAGGDGALEAEVLTRVHRRDHVRLSVRPDGAVPAGITEVSAVAAMTSRVVPGDRVALSLDADGIATVGS
ncbi:ABC transporter ATP-binding protein [Saccharomonospora piscinae]|uniref:ABC transporter ATP-binding protein n=1 Tax=Saccharomonospora piscinae TaxID=687388 RepID=UPI000467D897|nr:ABC transporter ATP-binding protein [Saccharomonospora piscinae]